MPAIAGVSGVENLPACCAEVDSRWRLVIRGHRFAQHQQVSVLLGQTLAQQSPTLPAVTAAPYLQPAFGVASKIRAFDRNCEQSLPLGRRDRETETEPGGESARDVSPLRGVDFGAIH